MPRSEIFILTKLHPRFLGHDSTIKAIDMSLKSLNVDYIDLFLIHSKECDDYLLKCQEGEKSFTFQSMYAHSMLPISIHIFIPLHLEYASRFLSTEKL